MPAEEVPLGNKLNLFCKDVASAAASASPSRPKRWKNLRGKKGLKMSNCSQKLLSHRSNTPQTYGMVKNVCNFKNLDKIFQMFEIEKSLFFKSIFSKIEDTEGYLTST